MKNMITLYALAIQLIMALQCSSTPPQEQMKPQTGANTVQTDRQWRAGTYLGLTVGKSTKADMLRILGEPKRLDAPPDLPPDDPNAEVWYLYDRGGEFPGELTIVTNKRTEVVLGIDLNPDNLSKEEAIKHFGPDYILTRYSFEDCLGNEESAPLYESANGPVVELEYRRRGLAMSIDDDGKVNTISYVSKPIGTPKSRCKPSNR